MAATCGVTLLFVPPLRGEERGKTRESKSEREREKESESKREREASRRGMLASSCAPL